MLKHKCKIIAIIIAIITFISTFCYAENEITNNTVSSDTNVVTTSETSTDQSAVTTSENTENPDSLDSTYTQPEIYEGDLYLFDSNVKMDKLVNGNVYIMGNNVEITGQVAGNIFVLGNNVTFNQSFIQSSVFVLANTVSFNAVSSDLYVSSSNLEIPAKFGVYRDLKASCGNVSISGNIGRDAYIDANSISLEKDNQKAAIYGDLNYTSQSEITVPDGSVEGEISYSKKAVNTSSTRSLQSYIISLISTILFTLFIYLLLRLIAPKSMEKLSATATHSMPKILGLGILSLILIPIISIILMITVVGVPISFLLLVLYGLLISISTATFTIGISSLFCYKRNISKKLAQYLTITISTIIVWIVTILPFGIGSIAQLIFTIVGLGIILFALFTKNINLANSSDKKENKSEIEKAKRNTKNKEKKKVEKKIEKKTKNSQSENSKEGK